MRSSQNLANKNNKLRVQYHAILPSKFCSLGANFRLNPSGCGKFLQLTAQKTSEIGSAIPLSFFLVSCKNWLRSAFAKPLLTVSMNTSIKYISIFLTATVLTACANTIEKLENVGKAPPVSQIANPVEQPSYKPVSWPTPVEPAAYNKRAGSLWASGSRSFFKDQRAARVGDILTIIIDIKDEAGLTNKTARGRTSTENLAAPNVFGLEEKLLKFLPGDPQLDNLLNVTGNNTVEGNGSIDRQEQIKLKIAAMVTQILPNGNMVLRGTQDVRVNFEVRQVMIEGVIRPQDISSENTVLGEQIAEARVSYGGQGTISDVQQPRVGTQVIDILSPF